MEAGESTNHTNRITIVLVDTFLAFPFSRIKGYEVTGQCGTTRTVEGM